MDRKLRGSNAISTESEVTLESDSQAMLLLCGAFDIQLLLDTLRFLDFVFRNRVRDIGMYP